MSSEPAVLWRRGSGPQRGRPLILLLHGHGADEADIFPLADVFPREAAVAALRGPIPSEGGYRWYAHHDVGRPIAASLAAGIAYVEDFLAGAAREARPLWLAGFSGGALMAGALLLHAPERFAGAALMHGTLPFGPGLDPAPDRLARNAVFYGYGEADDVIPRDLIARTRTYLREASGATVTINAYRAGHEIPPAEQRDLARWYAEQT